MQQQEFLIGPKTLHRWQVDGMQWQHAALLMHLNWECQTVGGTWKPLLHWTHCIWIILKVIWSLWIILQCQQALNWLLICPHITRDKPLVWNWNLFFSILGYNLLLLEEILSISRKLMWVNFRCLFIYKLLLATLLGEIY